VNDLLKEWVDVMVQDRDTRIIQFVSLDSIMKFDEESVLFERDGLHLSRAGSEHLGKQLAPIIKTMLLQSSLTTGLDLPNGFV